MGKERKWRRGLYIRNIFFLALRLNAGYGPHNNDVSKPHTTTHHSRYGSSGRMISSLQRPPPGNTTHTRHWHPWPRWDSNPQSQQASCRGLASQTARPRGPAIRNACLLTHLLTTYFMELSSWEANRFWAMQEVPRIIWKPKVHYHIHMCPPPVPILS